VADASGLLAVRERGGRERLGMMAEEVDGVRQRHLALQHLVTSDAVSVTSWFDTSATSTSTVEVSCMPW
jgi:hypothetical protein